MVASIHPSALHWAALCPRRFVGAHGDEQLPPTLTAIRGRILHAVREDLAGRPDRSATALRAVAEAAFLAARTKEQAQLGVRPWWQEWFDLGEHLPWQSAKSVVLPMANRLGGTPRRSRKKRHPDQARDAAPLEGTKRVTDHVDPLPGVEIHFSTAELGLRGVVDEVRAGREGWVVVEMKTTDRAARGDAATIQVLAYALALEAVGAGPVSHCEVLGPGGLRAVPFDDDARRSVYELLELARAVDGSVALPGQSVCRSCPVRDSCPAYRECSESRWEAGQPCAEDDVWGLVSRVDPAESDTVTVRLSRPDGARVLVRGVPSSRRRIETGVQVAAFGLRTTGARRLHGAAAAPTALHERPVGVAAGLPPGWGAFWQDGRR